MILKIIILAMGPLLMPAFGAGMSEAEILELAHTVNNRVANQIGASSTALTELLDETSERAGHFSEERIRSYVDYFDLNPIHIKNLDAKISLLISKIQKSIVRRLTMNQYVEYIGKTIEDKPAHYREFNCGMQARLASYWLKREGVSSVLLGTPEVDHGYVGLLNDTGKIFAITDPWSGRVFRLEQGLPAWYKFSGTFKLEIHFRPQSHGPTWINYKQGDALPPDSVISGEPNKASALHQRRKL